MKKYDMSTIVSFLTETEFLFGILDTDDIDFRINFILFVRKFLVYKEKIFGEGQLDPCEFIVELKRVLTNERMACTMEHSLL